MPSSTIAPLTEERTSTLSNPLPTILHTPSGLAILELQGTINAPTAAPGQNTAVGRLVFPHHDPQAPADDTRWMKRVYLYVGDHQRMTGEVRKLVKPLIVLRKRQGDTAGEVVEDQVMGDGGDGAKGGEGGYGTGSEEIAMAEVIRYKIVFASRPEPTGVMAAAGGGDG